MFLTATVFIGEVGFVLRHRYWSEKRSESALEVTPMAALPDTSEDVPETDLKTEPVLDEQDAEPMVPSAPPAVEQAPKPKKSVTPAIPTPVPKKRMDKNRAIAAVPAKPNVESTGSVATALIAPEHYLMEAWRHVHLAQKNSGKAENEWERAIHTVDEMINKHPQWAEAAEKQNRQAAASGDAFPYTTTKSKISMSDVQPLFQKYWALYHVGAAEFIRVMGYTQLQKIALARNDKRAWADFQWKKVDAAERIVSKYSYAQAFDQGGWMWQPVKSLSEYVDPSELTVSVAALNP